MASAAARQAPPVDHLLTPALPAADQQQNGGTQECANEAAHSGASLGKAGEQTGAGRPFPTPSPATLTHRQPTGPRSAPTAAWQPRLHVYTRGGRAGDKR